MADTVKKTYVLVTPMRLQSFGRNLKALMVKIRRSQRVPTVKVRRNRQARKFGWTKVTRWVDVAVCKGWGSRGKARI